MRKKKLLLLLLVITTVNSFGQESPTEQAQPIVAEGKRLYKSEMASWYGTDLFLEAYKERENIGGYFSYSENEVATCIFFSKSEKPKVIGSITFDSTYNTKTAITDLKERDFTELEYNLFSIRKIALSIINSDTLFRSYNNTSLNLIPLISGNEKKVYVLTGPQQNGVVIFGNDYLLTFDNDNNIAIKKQLHKNIIAINYGAQENGDKTVVGTMHSHSPETDDFITATDICTLMLYEKFTGWKQHNVVSKKYLNIWNCLTNELTVLSMETLDKIYKNKGDRKSKQQSDE